MTLTIFLSYLSVLCTLAALCVYGGVLCPRPVYQPLQLEVIQQDLLFIVKSFCVQLNVCKEQSVVSARLRNHPDFSCEFRRLPQLSLLSKS